MKKTKKDFVRVIRPGSVKTYDNTSQSLYCKIKYNDGKLSITGVVGPMSNGDCRGSAGQNSEELKNITKIAPGWTQEMINRLYDVWERWHLNDMRPDCEHQRGRYDVSKKIEVYDFTWSDKYFERRRAVETGKATEAEYKEYRDWVKRTDVIFGTKKPAHPSLVQDLLDDGLIDVKKTEEKAAGWVYCSSHPEGLLCKPCDVCGYEYGSKWLFESVPEEVIDFLVSLPDTDREPAWV